MRLMLPYPISANRYWRSFVPRGHVRAIVTVSDEAKAYKSRVAWEAKVAGVKMLTVPVSLVFRLVPANRVCMDIDNALKVSIDALKGIAYTDDALVRRIVAERMEPDGRARLEVEIDVYYPSAAPLFAEAFHGQARAAA